jgi:hypothetical protein
MRPLQETSEEGYHSKGDLAHLPTLFDVPTESQGRCKAVIMR